MISSQTFKYYVKNMLTLLCQTTWFSQRVHFWSGKRTFCKFNELQLNYIISKQGKPC